MSRTIDPGKGSKRKVRQVGWTGTEVIRVILLLLVLAGETICIALWLMTHTFD